MTERARLTAGRFLGVAIIAASFGLGWLLMDFQHFLQTPLRQLDEPEGYVVAPGSGLIAVSRDLQARGHLEHPLYLVWYARWRGDADSIVAGEYLLQPGMRPGELLDQLTRGDVMRYTLTVPEGWTFRQLLSAVHRHEKIVNTLSPDLDEEGIMAALGHPGVHPEGRFFPDTYQFIAGTTDVVLLRRAYEAMETLLQRVWAERAPDLPLATPDEALILASIIEKETGAAEERGRIAGVFIRRLRLNMRLQTDPTVIYGLGEEYGGRLRIRDLRRDTPYNTYTRRGLPPTPIALPGAESLRAAVNPADGDEIFFVSRGDGTHYFSSTLELHERAVRKYQLGMSDEVLP